MMEGMFGGSGSKTGNSGTNDFMQKAMERKMLQQIFGLEAIEKPVEMAAEVIGTDPNGSFGVVGLRLMPPTPTLPFARLLLETNGQLSIDPIDLRKAAAFFQSVAEKFTTLYEEQNEKAKSMEGYDLIIGALGINSL